MSSPKSAGGRPAKFAEPSRPVTVTLPERTLQDLETIGPDRGSAIVKLVDAVLAREEGRPSVEVTRVGPDTGLIIVGPSSRLRRIPFLHMVEIAPARFLLALEPGHDFRSLELAIQDLLEESDEPQSAEHSMLASLIEHIKRLRKSAQVSMAEILFVRLACAVVAFLPQGA